MSASADDAAQSGFAYRFDWGLDGLHALAPNCDVIVVVDVLRFTTAVSAAVDADATVFPFRWKDSRAVARAAEVEAVLAGLREDGAPSLSPTDLLRLRAGTRLLLPSPNGSTIALVALELGVRSILAGSLRNATATARRARELAPADGAIGVIAAGERWGDAAGPLRPSYEDLLGAGAVLAALDPSASMSHPGCSPEGAAARATFLAARADLRTALETCASGRELARMGWLDDVATCAELDVSERAALLVDGAFVAA